MNYENQNMELISEKTAEQIRQEDLQRLAGFRPIDDTFARAVFKNRPELAEFVLRIITRLEDLEIDPVGYDTQFDAKRLAGSRSLMLDVHGGDTKGRKYDLEMEKWDASPERAEFHIATMLIEHLHEGEAFSDLPETYVIFMCEHDVVGNRRAVNQFSYRNDDLFMEGSGVEETIKPNSTMKGKTRIIFVNGDYEDEQSDIGKLIHDFKCSKPKEMFFPNLAERARHLKEDPEGVEEMCKEMEKVRQEANRASRLTDIINLMDFTNWDVEKAMEALKISPEERPLYAASAKAVQTRRSAYVTSV